MRAPGSRPAPASGDPAGGGSAAALLELRTGGTAPSWFSAAVTLGRLEVVSVFHSCVYTALLVCAFSHNPQPLTTILGFSHGILWIAISLVCIAAARFRVIPWWLAVCVAVLGGVGPFFGTAGFVLEARRRRRGGATE